MFHLQPVTLELGGKSPIVVFDDIDNLDLGLLFLISMTVIFCTCILVKKITYR